MASRTFLPKLNLTVFENGSIESYDRPSFLRPAQAAPTLGRWFNPPIFILE